MKTHHAWLVALSLAAAPAFAAEPVAEPVAEAAVAPAKSEGWALGYTLGYTFAQRVNADIKDLDIDAFEAGLREGYAGQPGQLTEEQMQQALNAFQEKRVAEMQAAQQREADENLARANEFLKKNGKRKGVKTTASGLQYEVQAKGKGASPKGTDLVTAHYHGTFPDGTVFDSSRGGDPVEFPLDRVIPGWTEGLQMMKVGAKYKFTLPPSLGYGERGYDGAIPPNQVLVFEVELVSFREKPAEAVAAEAAEAAEAAPAADSAAPVADAPAP